MGRWIAATIFGLLLTTAQADSQLSAPEQSSDTAQLLRGYFFDAARRGDQVMVKDFIHAGYDLNVRDEKGYTGLILAAYHGQRDVVELLLAAGGRSLCPGSARPHRRTTSTPTGGYRRTLAGHWYGFESQHEPGPRTRRTEKRRRVKRGLDRLIWSRRTSLTVKSAPGCRGTLGIVAVG